MSTRRTFFQSLAAAPLALLGVKFAPQLFQLPVGCDLSMTSLEVAINYGRNFGLPRLLMIGPENIFPARELLGRSAGTEWTVLDEDPVARSLREWNLRYEVRRDLPYNTWRVEFERGIVESQGP